MQLVSISLLVYKTSPVSILNFSSLLGRVSTS